MFQLFLTMIVSVIVIVMLGKHSTASTFSRIVVATIIAIFPIVFIFFALLGCKNQMISLGCAACSKLDKLRGVNK